MTAFVSRISNVTGKQEWVLQDESYDYHQEIARAAYADMLHDTERNQKYELALRDAVQIMHDRGKPANVLDIGTGTGLLSMMAVRCGADSVTACEAFAPMAKCAAQVMKDNGFSDRILLVHKRSNEVTVGPDSDMPQRANILVTEVFDTELIGEGAIPTFSHAHRDLLEADCIVVPSAANMYCQVVTSDLAHNWSRFQPISIAEHHRGAAELVERAAERLSNGGETCNGDTVPSLDIRPPSNLASCPGSISVHDLQMDQLRPEWFTPVTDPVRVFRFDYSGSSPISPSGHTSLPVPARTSGRCDAVFMWWDLEMDTRGRTTLSCAPGWGQEGGTQPQWRDHWMQAVYYPQHRPTATTGDPLTLHACHDEYSLWFDVRPALSEDADVTPDPPACRCGGHILCGWTRLGMMNDRARNDTYLQVMRNVITPDTVCLSISDGSLLPLMAARLGAKKVYTLETQPLAQRVIKSYIAENDLETTVTVICKQPEEVTGEDFDNHKISLVVGEPFFQTSTLPWHNLLFWYCLAEIHPHLAPEVTILPWVATVKAVVVDFDDLWKIRAPVGECEGLDLASFDRLIESASSLADAYLEPQPLWEYPGTPLSDQFDILSLDFSRPLSSIKGVEREGFIQLWSSGRCTGVAVWIDYHLSPSHTIQSGLLTPPTPGDKLDWDVHSRQAVHLFPAPVTVPEGETDRWRLKHKVCFKPKTGDLDFKFEIVKLDNQQD